MKKTRVLKALLLLVVALTAGMGNAWAQEDINMYPPKVDIKDAEITEFGHLTMTVKDEVVVDSLTMTVDTIAKVESIDWNTETGTAKKRMASRRRKAAATGSDFYDKDSNWWWDMWWFVFKYPSINAKGEPIVLSALACMPDEDCDYVNSVIIGCHSTITANRECPSMNNHNGLLDTNDTDFFMLHASSGWAVHASESDRAYYNLVIIPDYEGYGLTKDVPHPYLSEEVTARQVVDGVRYGIELYKTSDKVKKVRHKFRDNWRSLCVGYSQGGGTSMAVHRFIEQNNLVDELHFTGSICGAGPYNPVTTIMYYMYQAEKGEKMSMAVVLPLILKGMCDSNPYMRNHQVSEYLSKPFLDTGILDWLSSKEYSTSDIKEEWDLLRETSSYYSDVVEEGGEAYMKKIMTPDGYDYFKQALGNATTIVPSGLYLDITDILGLVGIGFFADDMVYAPDPERPTKRGVMEDLHLALAYNDLTKGWNPEHPLYMYHSYYDDVVPLVNRVCAKEQFGDWVTRINPSVHLGHVGTAIEFLAGTEEYGAVRKLANTSIHPSPKALGKAERIYKGTVGVWGTIGKQTYYIPTGAEYVLRKNAAGDSVAILGSGYNPCISQYLSGKVKVPSTIQVNGKTYPVAGVNDMAFRMCTKLTHVILPEGVERIGDFAFYACRSLLEVDLPSTLKTIGTGAFIDLPNLQSVTCRAVTPPTWEYNDVFCFHEQGIGDTNTYTTDNVMLWVPDNLEETYRNANFTNSELGWNHADGWGYFDRNIRSISDFNSEAYAVFTPADSTLAFYYDGRRSAHRNRGERTFDLNGKNLLITDQYPGWTDNTGGGANTSSDDPEDHSKEIAHVVFTPSFYFCRPVTTAKWFAGCENLETIEGWDNLNGEEVLSTSFMFDDCKKLRDDDMDLSYFVTPKCEYFIYMFSGCESLTTLDLSHFDTSSAVSMVNMFDGCSRLTYINLNSFDTRNVKNFQGMFYNCLSLESLEMEKLHIGHGASVGGFFANCSSLEKLTLPFEIETAEGMFGGLNNMRDIYYFGVKPFVGWDSRHTDFMPDKQTRFHVLPMSLDAWRETWPNDEADDPYFYANVTYVADLCTEECPMEIYTEAQWELLNYFVEAGATGIYAKLLNDIKVTSMIGSSSHPFSGTFDGNGHTLTFELTLSENLCAPFRYISGTTIKNLVVEGNSEGFADINGDLVSYRQIAGLAGWAGGNNQIKNVVVNENVGSAYNGDSSNGGFIAHIGNGSTLMEGCLFAGHLYGFDFDFDLDAVHVHYHTTDIGGFVGWTDGSATLRMTNCVFAPDSLYVNATGSQTFARASNSNSVTLENCYYTIPITGSQGKKAYTITSGSEGLTIDVTEGTTYDVSQITACGNNGGIKVGDTIYGGNGDKVKLDYQIDNGYDMSNLKAVGAASETIDAEGRVTMAAANCVITANVGLGTLYIYDDRDNTADLEALSGMTLDVQLAGRTLYKDDDWNTISLPFDLSEEQIANSPLAGCTLVTLTDASYKAGTLTLTFADTTAISADRSYLIKWPTGIDITNPVFTDVTISRALPAGIKYWMVEDKSAIAFKGTYNRIDFSEENKSVLFLGADNTLYYPGGKALTYIGACRAFFDIYGLTADDLVSSRRNYVLKFSNTTNVEGTVNSDSPSSDFVYDLSGRRILLPSGTRASSVLPKGVYIQNGKKVVIK